MADAWSNTDKDEDSREDNAGFHDEGILPVPKLKLLWPGNSARCIGGRVGLGRRCAPRARDAQPWPPTGLFGSHCQSLEPCSATGMPGGLLALSIPSQPASAPRPGSRAIDHRDPASSAVRAGKTPAHNYGRAQRDQSASQSGQRAGTWHSQLDNYPPSGLHRFARGQALSRLAYCPHA